ncbi:hypothetical protein AB0D65_12640 [Streptomyces griseoloalbus]|uniref:Uncharacterized protein n=1 Tax=Streptomyces griseoloalbus TaxID=67303 RepID=A0ABV3E3W1_9ACTN
MSVVESWSRVMGLLREHAPADHADLPEPATEQMLAAAEERMGIQRCEAEESEGPGSVPGCSSESGRSISNVVSVLGDPLVEPGALVTA